jgi:hypothetical protein
MKWKKGDIAYILRQKLRRRQSRFDLDMDWKVVFFEYDDDEREYALVIYPGSRHIARVPIGWLSKPTDD